jgi:hypothetical protein
VAISPAKSPFFLNRFHTRVKFTWSETGETFYLICYHRTAFAVQIDKFDGQQQPFTVELLNNLLG